jgi:predicted acyltransferase
MASSPAGGRAFRGPKRPFHEEGVPAMNEFPQGRLVSLDVFRGMTIAGMVLVNNPGTWSAIYGPLRHAEWHGITPTDYIFPFFLFIVGVAIPIALGKRIREGLTRDVYLKILARSVAIFASGLAISAVPLFIINRTEIPWPFKWLATLSIIAALFFLYLRRFRVAFGLLGVWGLIVFGFHFAGWEVVAYDVNTMRIPGVLQRIAVCYLVVSLLYLHTNWKQQAGIGVGLLLLYWFLMTRIAVPGCEIATVDDKACNLAAYLDRTILTMDHMWRGSRVFDPEGILSTLPAIVTTLSGVLTGTWLLRKNGGASVGDVGAGSAPPSVQSSIPAPPPVSPTSPTHKAVGLFFAGTVLLALGWWWSQIFPLNKSLWTSSYVVYTSGLALLTLGCCYYLIDVLGYKWWTKPFVIFGVNALALFVFSGMMARMLGIIRVTGPEGQDIALQQWIFNKLFLSWADPVNASLAYAVSFILLWLFLMWLLYRRRVFIKL